MQLLFVLGWLTLEMYGKLPIYGCCLEDKNMVVLFLLICT